MPVKFEDGRWEEQVLGQLVNRNSISSWRVGSPPGAVTHNDGVVALNAGELHRSAGVALGFHEVASSIDVHPTATVHVGLPGYRGKAFVRVLSWLIVTRLATPDATVWWHMTKQQGPDSIGTLLADLGWRSIARDRARDGVRVRMQPPASQGDSAAAPPEAARFTGTIGRAALDFDADYGVFSPAHLDAGTGLLAEVALRESPVDTLADIGLGYGPLAIGLVRNGIAARAVGTDIDCIALWLAQRNAAANGVPLAVTCGADPTEIPPTPLTVCNLPTHLDRASSAALMDGLCRRARGARLLMVVHASLEARFTRYLINAGLSVRSHAGQSHVVLAADGR